MSLKSLDFKESKVNKINEIIIALALHPTNLEMTQLPAPRRIKPSKILFSDPLWRVAKDYFGELVDLSEEGRWV